MSLADKIKSAGTIIVTIAVFLFVALWMIAVLCNLGKAPVYDANGVVVVDEYSRAKDILVLVLPLLTTAVGYWLGSQGTAKAEEKAKKADDQRTAILSASTDPDLLGRARKANEEAFK